jgi:hypothetical protein
MIRVLEFERFKSWNQSGSFKLHPISGLFGPNSSGKSSVIQSLLLFKQTAESLDRSRVLHLGDARAFADFGTFSDVIHRHEIGETLTFSVTWDPAQTLEVRDPSRRDALAFEAASLTFSTAIEQVGKHGSPHLLVREFRYRVGDNEFGMRLRDDSPMTRADARYDLISQGYELRRRRGRPWPLPAPTKSYGFPDQVANYFKDADFVDDLAFAFEGLMSGISYVGPLRENPHRLYLWGGERPATVGQRGELAIEALLAARSEGRKVGRGLGRGRRYVTLERRVAQWLKDLGLIDSFSVRQLGRNRKEYEVRVRQAPGSSEVLLPDVGFGVSQILPVLVQCYYAPEGSTILFEQPELHLHPRVQSGLADVFIDAARERDVQIILESHSEHLLRRLQLRVAEGDVTSDDVALYFVDFRGGESSAERLQVDLYGNITNWPLRFFGDDLGELSAMVRAQAKRVDG